MRIYALAGVLAVALGGCASEQMTIHGVPSEKRVAVNAAQSEIAAAFADAAATAAATEHEKTALPVAGAAPEDTPADAPSMQTYDPWERTNRLTYRFNARFDEAIFLPVSNRYRRAVPGPIRTGVYNFFANLGEADSVINYALQLRIGYGARSLGRFLINSTIGIGGLFDIAKRFNLPAVPTGFSATLANWGMHPGPYLVIPLLGPSTLRDGVGYAADYGTAYAVNVAGLYRGNASYGLTVVHGVDDRSRVRFRYYATGSPFEYEIVRFLYVRKRLIEDEGLRAKHRKGNTQSESQQENAVAAPAGK